MAWNCCCSKETGKATLFKVSKRPFQKIRFCHFDQVSVEKKLPQFRPKQKFRRNAADFEIVWALTQGWRNWSPSFRAHALIWAWTSRANQPTGFEISNHGVLMRFAVSLLSCHLFYSSLFYVFVGFGGKLSRDQLPRHKRDNMRRYGFRLGPSAEPWLVKRPVEAVNKSAWWLPHDRE